MCTKIRYYLSKKKAYQSTYCKFIIKDRQSSKVFESLIIVTGYDESLCLEIVEKILKTLNHAKQETV